MIALVHRVPVSRAFDLLESREWTLAAVEALLQKLPPIEQEQAVRQCYASICQHPEPVIRALALAMVQRLRSPGLDELTVRAEFDKVLGAIKSDLPPGKGAELAAAIPAESPWRSLIIDSVLRSRNQVDRLDDWGGVIKTLASAVPPPRLLSLLETLEGVGPRGRVTALEGLGALMAQHLPATEQRSALSQILAMAMGDPRRDLLAQLHAARPLLVSSMAGEKLSFFVGEVLRIEGWFP
jgi:hypothetical protein